MTRLGEELIAFFAGGGAGGLHPAAPVAEYRRRIRRASREPAAVLVAEADPARFLGALAAALAENARVFLANPDWGSREWAAVAEQVRPDVVFGRAPVEIRGDRSAVAGIPDDPFVAIPTGGTGGRVRFAVHEERTLRAAAEGFREWFGGGPLACCSELPCFHVSGLMPVLRAALSGGAFVWAPSGGSGAAPKPDAANVLSLVPTQLARLLKEPDGSRRLAGFSAVLVGGGPLAPDLGQAAREKNLPLAPSYGTTETAAVVRMVRPEEFLAGDDSSGRDLPHARVTVGDGTPGREGPIRIQSKSLFLGYLSDPEPPSEPWSSGDTGYLDEAGRLYVTGRIRPVINSGGEKIDPGEVEKALLDSGIAREAHVVGTPDPEWGETVTALYTPATPDAPTSAHIEHLKTQLAPHKRPKRWIPITRLPRTPQGKLDPAAVQTILGQSSGKNRI